MATIHTVQRGESLSVIATRYGFRNWRTIYDHPSNAAFRKKRPNPNLIGAGDQIVIPEKVTKQVTASTGQTHTYQASSAKQRVEFLLGVYDLLNPSEPIPTLTVKLRLPGGQEKELKTDSSGEIKLSEPEITAGQVDVLDIRDEKDPAVIRYLKYAKTGLATNQSNQLLVPDKRKIIDRIASIHKVQRRRVWGSKTPSYTAMDEDWDYTTVVIHHSGNSGEKEPKEIERKHMDENGWDDVGYHYLIKPDGTIFEGRHLAYKGSHVEKANSQKIGILIMGDFEHQWWDGDDDPTATQISAAEALIKTLKSEIGTVTKLGGHRDYKPGTECPGGEMYGRLGGFRAATGLGGP